jgi:hypothetical protein
MANVYTTLLLGGPFGLTPGQQSAAVPVGYVWDVRGIEISNEGDLFASYVGFSIYHDGSDYGTVKIAEMNPAIGQVPFRWQGRALIPPGATLHCVGAGTLSYNSSITGYQLTLP